jgi:hypothetical protein
VMTAISVLQVLSFSTAGEPSYGPLRLVVNAKVWVRGKRRNKPLGTT